MITKKPFNRCMLLGAFIYALCLSNCATKPTAPTVDIEQSIKDDIVNNESSTGIEPLSVVRRIQSLAADGGAFVVPASLAVTSDGWVYVSDNNGKSIHYCPPQSESIATLPQQGGLGALKWPNTIKLFRKSILISDNDGIKVFSTDGSFQRLVRIYFGISYFDVQKDGNIYVNPTYPVGNSSDALVLKLTGEGTLSGSFGKRLNNTSTAGLEDRVFVCLSDKYVFAVFQHRPLVQIYSSDGVLIREITVTHPAFDRLAALSKDDNFVHPKEAMYRLPYYISGASIVDKRLLLLLSLPSPEVIEFDLSGQEICRYRGAKLTSPTVYMGFDARLVGDKYHFWTIAGDTKRVMSLLEMTGLKRR